MTQYRVSFPGFSVKVDTTRDKALDHALAVLEHADGNNGIQFDTDLLNGEVLPDTIDEEDED
jgi:hypothetical protein